MPDPRTINQPGSGTATQSYELAPGLLQYVQAVYVDVDNSGGVATSPTLTVSEQSGVVIAKKQQGKTIDAGISGSATWALRLDDETTPGVTSVVSGDPNLWTFPTTGPAVTVGRFSLAAQIARTAGAVGANVASGALVITTTNVQHNVVVYAAGVTASVSATPSRLTIVQPGLYVIQASSSWIDFGAADFGLSVGIATGATPLVNPGMISRRVPNEVMVHETTLITRCQAGDVFTQAVGQDSGAPIAMPIGTLTAYRLGPRP